IGKLYFCPAYMNILLIVQVYFYAHYSFFCYLISMLIIGITGTLGAGKGVVADYLVKKYGFKHISVRSYLEKHLNKRGVEVSRISLVDMANELRDTYGAEYIAVE